MSMEFLEVVERIDLVQLARMNQTHVQIADHGAIWQRSSNGAFRTFGDCPRRAAAE